MTSPSSIPSIGLLTDLLGLGSDGTVAFGPVYFGSVTLGNFTVDQAFSEFTYTTTPLARLALILLYLLFL